MAEFKIERTDVIEPAADATLVVGGPATGKSTFLARRACELAAGGHPDGGSASVLVVSATAQRAELMAEGIAAAAGTGAVPANVEVLSIRQLALEVMDDPAARVRFGREPHVLDAQERADFTEDMRTSSIKRKRLREIVMFLECGWSNLDDDDPHWLITTEELGVVDMIHRTLMLTGGILDSEASALAFKTLRADGEARARHGRDHVLVDDYQLLGRASQALASRVAAESVTVASDDAPGVPEEDPYPFADGIAEFLKANPNARQVRLETCRRPQAIVDGLNALRADVFADCEELQGAGTADAPVVATYREGLADEFHAIADLLRQAQEAGLRDAFVAGTNGIWRANLERCLEECDFETRRARTGGRMRDEEAVADAAVARLAADPADALAWRTWVGCGDPLSRSAAVGVLRDVAAPQGLRLHEALALLAADELPGASKDDPLYGNLLEAYREGLRRIEQAQAAGAAGGAGEAPAAADGAPGDGGFRVLVGAPRDIAGRDFDLVVFGGFVNGLIPSREYLDPAGLVGNAKARAHVADVQAVCTCLGAARRQAAFTGFLSCSLEAAEQLKVHIVRIRARRGGLRIATTEPSELLALVAPQAS